ncbi:MAG TPA: WD40 repeat domain-containing protein [Anaerolineae bacterium]
MRRRHGAPGAKTEPESFSEFEQEIRPPVRKRLRQVLIGLLVLITGVSVIVTKVMSDQREQAVQKAGQAIAVQGTVEAQMGDLLAQVESMTATLQAPEAFSGTQLLQQLGPAGVSQMRSRELAYEALTSLAGDPERSILIALVANQASHTPEAEDALRRALMSSHIRLKITAPGANIQTAEFSPNGDFIVTTDSAGMIYLWNAYDGRMVFGPRQAGEALSAQFSPDGRFILALTANPSAVLWDAATGSIVTVFSSQAAQLTSAQFSSLGTRIATGGTDGSVRVWYTTNISEQLTLHGNIGPIRAVEWAPDDNRILATSDTGFSVWDAQTGKQLYIEEAVLAQVMWIRAHFSPDGRLLVAASPSGVRLLDANTYQVVRTISQANTDDAHFSPDGTQLLTEDAAYATQWDVNTGQVIARYPLKAGPSIQMSPNGRYLETHSDANTLSVWDLHMGWRVSPPLIAVLSGGSTSKQVRFSPYGELVVSVDADGAARVWAVMPDIDLPVDYQSLLALADTRITRHLGCEELPARLRDAACATAP